MMLPQTTGFGWNEIAHRYYSLDSGQFVPQSAIRESLENLIDVSGLQMNALTQKLQDGALSLADWQSGMMEQIKISHVASGALANGGWAQMGQDDWGAVGRRVREQYDYLRNFANEIADGRQPMDGRMLVRADMYADAANTTYSDIRTRSFIKQGYEEERRVLEVRDDGNCDDCIEYAQEGWQPIGTLPEPGQDSQCQVRCRCEKEFRIVSTEESETE